MGDLRSCLRRFSRLFGDAVGAVHVCLFYTTILLPTLIVAAQSLAIGCRWPIITIVYRKDLRY